MLAEPLADVETMASNARGHASAAENRRVREVDLDGSIHFRFGWFNHKTARTQRADSPQFVPMAGAGFCLEENPTSPITHRGGNFRVAGACATLGRG